MRPLRVVLAEQAEQAALQRIEEAARDLVTRCPRPSSGTSDPDRLPSPEAVNRLYLEAHQQREAYTAQWQTSHDALSIEKLEQLFVR